MELSSTELKKLLYISGGDFSCLTNNAEWHQPFYMQSHILLNKFRI